MANQLKGVVSHSVLSGVGTKRDGRTPKSTPLTRLVELINACELRDG